MAGDSQDRLQLKIQIDATSTACFLQGGTGLIDFWNRGGNVLIWGLQFEIGEIIWGLIYSQYALVQAIFLVSRFISELGS